MSEIKFKKRKSIEQVEESTDLAPKKIKIKYSLSILISCLEEAFMKEGNISPQQIAETKKACLHYLVN